MPRVMVDASLAGFQRNAAKSVAMLKALSNGKRLMILCKLLEHGEMNVMDLSAAVGLSQSALSQHLALMRERNMIGFTRKAQQVFYRVTDPRVRRILLTLKDIYC
jgi:DNA-binding transcriptional ArsR family regulator